MLPSADAASVEMALAKRSVQRGAFRSPLATAGTHPSVGMPDAPALPSIGSEKFASIASPARCNVTAATTSRWSAGPDASSASEPAVSVSVCVPSGRCSTTAPADVVERQRLAPAVGEVDPHPTVRRDGDLEMIHPDHAHDAAVMRRVVVHGHCGLARLRVAGREQEEAHDGRWSAPAVPASRDHHPRATAMASGRASIRKSNGV